MKRLYFACDYMEGCHPAILDKLVETNLEHTVGYGCDEYSNEAREKIRKACKAPKAEVNFLVGGTQTNSIVIKSILRPYQGVIAADTGHIAGHEAGAIEMGGHKVLTVPHTLGKLNAKQVAEVCEKYESDANHDHLVMPGMVYISHPTEYGTLYTKKELADLSKVCKKYGLPLYLDGARLAYALACPQNEITLADLAKYCDAFYIGGTKCGALFGEALVFPDPALIPHFFTIIKQNGALLAKGRLSGVQFGTLFTDNLYETIGESAIVYADKIRQALKEKNYVLCFDSPTNQVFTILTDKQYKKLAKHIEFSFWEKLEDDFTIVRFCTSWATTEEDVDALIEML